MTAERSDPDRGAVLDVSAEDADRRTIRDQRDANETLVLATLHAQEQVEAYEAAVAVLQASERDLRANAELREQLLAMVGHDLRQPLAAMTMAAQLLLMNASLNAQDTDLVVRLLKSGARMDRMIKHLLEFTRIRLGGGLAIAVAPAALGPICRQVVEELQPQTSVQIRCQLEGDLQGVWDADRLIEVLSNLVSNAIRYTTPGTPILIKAYDAGPEVVVEISNQGDPIPPEVLPNIFEPFRQGPPMAGSRPGVLGLGLFIAREIMRLHRGTLTVGCAGGATTFTMRLPRA